MAVNLFTTPGRPSLSEKACNFTQLDIGSHSNFSGKYLAISIFSTGREQKWATRCLREPAVQPRPVSHTRSTHGV